MITVFMNGVVYTGSLPLVEAFAMENGVFLYTGSNEEVCRAAGPDADYVDLEGRFACAGFNDSHMHLVGFGNALLAAQLGKHTTSLSDMLECLRAFEAEHPHSGGAWLKGRGWNQDYFTDVNRMPNRYDLDTVSTEVPICAVRACGHCLVVNSKALEILGVTGDAVQPDGGLIEMEDGEPTGRFFDNAMGLVYDVIPEPDKDTLKSMIRTACKALNRYGITSCQSDDYSTFANVPWATINQAYKELEASGDLTVRIYEQSNFTNIEALTEFVEAGNKSGVGSGYFKIGPLKMLGDGSLGARTAFVSKPYADDPTTCGLPVFTQETMDELVGYANRNGMHVAIHAIGDACLDRVLHAIEKALAECPREDHRHGVVHCQLSRPDQLQKMIDLGLHVYAQSIFLDYDIQIVEDRAGKELASTSYSWKTLMNGGLSVSNGSDCPVELPDVLNGIQCAVTRQNLSGKLGPYLPEQAFTVQEALDSFTIRGAEASFEENVKGRIQSGMYADFVILSANPFETDVHKIKDIQICGTFIGGRRV